MVGIYMSGSVHLSRIASKVPSSAKLTSITKRLSRFVSNVKIDAQDWYRPVAQGLVEHLVASGSELRLMIDPWRAKDKVSADKQLLMVSIAYRRRALSLANAKDGAGFLTARVAAAPPILGRAKDLLHEVYALIPQEAKVSLVGNSEFGNPWLAKDGLAAPRPLGLALCLAAERLVRLPRQLRVVAETAGCRIRRTEQGLRHGATDA
jgi:hypothetical protein